MHHHAGGDSVGTNKPVGSDVAASVRAGRAEARTSTTTKTGGSATDRDVATFHAGRDAVRDDAGFDWDDVDGALG